MSGLHGAINLWLHITAAAVWIGSQFFLVLVAIPALKPVRETPFYLAALRALTRRYGYLGWGSLALVTLTGLERLFISYPDLSILVTTSYGNWLLLKMCLAGAIILLTALHTFVVGPRLFHAMETADSPGSLRVVSLAVSTAVLLMSLGVLFLVAGMRSGLAG